MNEFDLSVPMVIEGEKVSARALSGLKQRLLKQFGGLTHFPQKIDGFQEIGRATYQDEIVILRVISEKRHAAFWNELKCDLQKQWNQKEILIVVRAITILHLLYQRRLLLSEKSHSKDCIAKVCPTVGERQMRPLKPVKTGFALCFHRWKSFKKMATLPGIEPGLPP